MSIIKKNPSYTVHWYSCVTLHAVILHVWACACVCVCVSAAEASLNVAITTSYGNEGVIVVRKCHQSQKWKELSWLEQSEAGLGAYVRHGLDVTSAMSMINRLKWQGEIQVLYMKTDILI